LNVGGALLTPAAGAESGSSGKIMPPQDSKIEKPVKKITLRLDSESGGESLEVV